MLNSTMDELVPISCEYWPELRDLFLQKWPEHELPYNIVQNYINWIRIDPKIHHLEVFSLNGSWRINGTFVLIDRYELYCYTLEDSNEKLLRALKLLDWDYSYRICAPLVRHLPALTAIFEENPNLKPISDPNNVLHLAKEKAINFEINLPEGFQIHRLDQKYAGQINTAWPFHCPGSEYSIKRCLAWNVSVGLFNEVGELIGWCLHSNLGLLSYLHVDERYRNRGFGELILKAISKQLALRGLNSYATVNPENEPSQRLFHKTGFVKKQNIVWMRNRAQKLVEWDF